MISVENLLIDDDPPIFIEVRIDRSQESACRLGL